MRELGRQMLTISSIIYHNYTSHAYTGRIAKTCTSAFGRERDKLNVHRELKRKRRGGDIREENIRV